MQTNEFFWAARGRHAGEAARDVVDPSDPEAASFAANAMVILRQKARDEARERRSIEYSALIMQAEALADEDGKVSVTDLRGLFDDAWFGRS